MLKKASMMPTMVPKRPTKGPTTDGASTQR